MREKRVTAIYKSKQPACSSTSQSEYQNKWGFFFNILKYPAKFSVSDLRNGIFAAGRVGRRIECPSAASFQIMCVWAPSDLLYLCTPVEGQCGDYF